MSVNSIVLVGRTGRDPEITYTQSGMARAKFSLAVDRGRKDQDGNKVTDWFSVEAWDKTAKTAADYATKGTLIGIQGRLEVQKWTKDGEKHERVVVVCERLRLLGSRSDGGGGGAAKLTSDEPDLDSDIPF